MQSKKIHNVGIFSRSTLLFKFNSKFEFCVRIQILEKYKMNFLCILFRSAALELILITVHHACS